MTSKPRGRKKRPLENIHPNTPKRLVREYKKLGCNQLHLANKIQVNDFYVNRLLKDGIEPTNPDIRVKLFLPKRKPKPRTTKETPAAPSPEWWERVEKKAIQVMVKKMKVSAALHSETKRELAKHGIE